MSRLIYAAPALRDLARLDAFLRHKDPEAARAAIRTIRESLGRLASHPQIGRQARKMAPEFREWFIRFGRDGYVALYRYDRETTVVLAVRHTKEAGY